MDVSFQHPTKMSFMITRSYWSLAKPQKESHFSTLSHWQRKAEGFQISYEFNAYPSSHASSSQYCSLLVSLIALSSVVYIFQTGSTNKHEHAIYENKNLFTCEIFNDDSRVHFLKGSDNKLRTQNTQVICFISPLDCMYIKEVFQDVTIHSPC